MTAYPSRAVMDGAEPVRRYRDIIAPPDDFPHTRGKDCLCEQGESDL